jgi:hypothetical protein
MAQRKKKAKKGANRKPTRRKKAPQRRKKTRRTSTESTPKKAQKATEPVDPTHENARKADFLAAFMDSGNVRLTARKIGIHRTTPYKWAKEDAEFRVAWEDARLVAVSVLEDEALRRAVNGVKKPIYQRGKLVGEVRDYSDTLTIFLLKNWHPGRYMDRVRQEVTGRGGAPVAVEPVPEDLSPLNVEELEFLRKIRAKLNAARGGIKRVGD